jgi:hypothetical protein
MVWLYIGNLKAERASACCLLALLFDPALGAMVSSEMLMSYRTVRCQALLQKIALFMALGQ